MYPDMKKIIDVINELPLELKKAIGKYPPMNSPHEGYAVILEELDELWDEIKIKQERHDYAAMRKEAMQVAAMGIRFILDITDKPR